MRQFIGILVIIVLVCCLAFFEPDYVVYSVDKIQVKQKRAPVPIAEPQPEESVPSIMF